MLGDVDSLASDVELREELLLDSSLFDGLLVANCKREHPRVGGGLASGIQFLLKHIRLKTCKMDETRSEESFCSSRCGRSKR